jgi:hypothetical protein
MYGWQIIYKFLTLQRKIHQNQRILNLEKYWLAEIPSPFSLYSFSMYKNLPNKYEYVSFILDRYFADHGILLPGIYKGIPNIFSLKIMNQLHGTSRNRILQFNPRNDKSDLQLSKSQPFAMYSIKTSLLLRKSP